MLGVIIVPWHIVVIQKGKEPPVILHKSLPERNGGIVGQRRPLKRVVEALDVASVLAKVAGFQAPPVDRLDDGPEQFSELACDGAKLFVERRLDGGIVDIAHQMNETLLLSTRHGFVSTIEVANQHAPKSSQDVMQDLRISSWRVHISDGALVGKNPNVMPSAQHSPF